MNSEYRGSGRILTVNGGSSSLKLALFGADSLDRQGSKVVERLGQGDLAGASDAALDAWASEGLLGRLSGVGHRIVQGGPRLLAHVRVTDDVLDELRKNQPLDPEHLPGEIALMEKMAARFPSVPQVACFDSA